MSYDLQGQLLDFCTCGEGCYCQMGTEGDGEDCQAVNAWHINDGTIEGTDVSGLTLVALSTVPGHVLPGRPVKYYVDKEATAEQVEALGRAWAGGLSGPLADLAELSGGPGGIERASITFNMVRGHGALRVGEAVAASGIEPGPDGGEGRGDICTTMPGAQGTAGRASSYSLQVADRGIHLDLRDRKVVYGSFHFQG